MGKPGFQRCSTRTWRAAWPGRWIENVEIVALNPFVDLALAKAAGSEGFELSHVVLGSLDDLNAGDGVFAVGNPLGRARTPREAIR